ncbi:PrpF domain-containing protein [Sphingobium sp. Sx8-8]|uniref:PrpF domain-containing protein n=1 Tax=Sphingobium sp. Sx8-8 TaxID=2933617 RepID=UPI001F5AE5A7|nr:PrpF domain-containing protein [Sphingobium sp. Sx8-8]
MMGPPGWSFVSLLLQAITGMILVFRDELQPIIHPALRVTTRPRAVPVQAILDSIAARHPDAAITRAELGSPDPNGRQLDGMGEGISSLSKIAIVGPSTHPAGHDPKSGDLSLGLILRAFIYRE